MLPILTAILPVVSDLIDRIIPDKTKAAEAKAEAEAQLLAALAKEDSDQAEINKIEAGSSNIFVSGWRPAIGWLCAIALGYNYLGYPLLLWIKAIWFPALIPPPLASETLMELVMALLGMGGLRTFEKIKGVTK